MNRASKSDRVTKLLDAASPVPADVGLVVEEKACAPVWVSASTIATVPSRSGSVTARSADRLAGLPKVCTKLPRFHPNNPRTRRTNDRSSPLLPNSAWLVPLVEIDLDPTSLFEKPRSPIPLADMNCPPDPDVDCAYAAAPDPDTAFMPLPESDAA